MEFEISKKQIKDFQIHILDWYTKYQRDLPWRKTRDPYKILISEIMLQQTQVSRVIPKYESWIQKFPTVESLANARVSDVLKFWSGLGYNRRALNLKKTAEIIMRDFEGKFPQDEKLLRSLPGIGIYTSRAVLCFAFDHQIAVVDTNIKKVILTQFNNRHRERSPLSDGAGRRATISSYDEIASLGRGSRFAARRAPKAASSSLLAMTDKEIQIIADQLLPYGLAYEWNQALMDYSNTMLKEYKIPIPKQSKFFGSHRYYRGQALKILLEKKRVPVSEIGKLLEKDHEKEWCEKLLADLESEGFIKIKNQIVSLM